MLRKVPSRFWNGLLVVSAGIYVVYIFCCASSAVTSIGRETLLHLQ